MTAAQSATCPVLTDGDAARITLAHGEGGKLSRKLIRGHMLPRLGNRWLQPLGDAAVLSVAAGRLAFSTDSFVVSPLFFPGGDIGSLAVFGTTNDLAVSGARPMWLSLSLIMEEGLPLSVLDQVLDSIAAAAHQVGVQIVAGDTKVVPRGAADGLFINTSGIGKLSEPAPLGPATLIPGDRILLTGPIAQHGMAVLAARESFAVEPPPRSDCGSLLPAVEALRSAAVPVKAMRDATRGGVAAVLHEWSDACGLTLSIDEASIPLSGEVRGLCEILGLDPLFVANEGTMLVAVGPDDVDQALAALRSESISAQSVCIGSVAARTISPVTIRRALGRAQPLDEPLAALLPRIC